MANIGAILPGCGSRAPVCKADPEHPAADRAMRPVTVAALQMACGGDATANLDKAEALIRRAAAGGAEIILPPELFETPYFCKEQRPEAFALARSVSDNPVLDRFAALARDLDVVLPVSFFERAGHAYFNTVAIIDADGTRLGTYRKSHIPDGPGYQEKFYFAPGDTGFRAWRTRHGTIGVGICWDQWFPEAARAMALRGAEILFYPTAIGSEPQDPSLDSRDHWRRVIQGHAGANMMPIVTANRIGHETGESCALDFYGSSFIAGAQGEIVAEAGRDDETVVMARFDLDVIDAARASWGLFRDRRPDLYQPILNHDPRAT